MSSNQARYSIFLKPFQKSFAKKSIQASAVFDTPAQEASLGIISFHENQLLYSNPYVSMISGYSKEELLKMQFIDLIHPDSKEFVQRKITEILKRIDGSFYFIVKAQRKSGETYWIDVDISTFILNGKKSILAIIFDITEK